MADSTDEDSPECQACGSPVAASSDRRVVSTVEDDTAVHLHFCNDDCLETWDADT